MQALALYTLALRDEKLTEKLVAPVLSAMEEYLNRSLEIVLSETFSSSSAVADTGSTTNTNNSPLKTSADASEAGTSSALSSHSPGYDFSNPPLPSVRREALAAMMPRGFSVLKRGVSQYKQGKAESDSTEPNSSVSTSESSATVDRDWRIIVRCACACVRT
jgi:hypothetical protein